MKFSRVLSRIALICLAAAAFAGLTEMYGPSIRFPSPDPIEQAEKLHRAPGPRVSQFPEFIGYVFIVVFFAGIGRALRLRLSPAPRGEGRPMPLKLH